MSVIFEDVLLMGEPAVLFHTKEEFEQYKKDRKIDTPGKDYLWREPEEFPCIMVEAGRHEDWNAKTQLHCAYLTGFKLVDEI